MELGAYICTGQRATCSDCPLQTSCAALSHVRDHQAATADGPAQASEPSVLDYPAKVNLIFLRFLCPQTPYLALPGDRSASSGHPCRGSGGLLSHALLWNSLCASAA